jgi:DNA-binding response OmpR family regulator
LAIINPNESRRDVLESGVDDCVHAVNAEALLGVHVERAIRSRLVRDDGVQTGVVHLLVSAEENLPLAQLGASCHRKTCHVAFSYDYEGTLGLLRCTEVDAIVLDGALAARNGYKPLRDIRHEFPNLPILVAIDHLTDGPAAVSHGATEYIPMPAARAELMQMVTSALRTAQQESTLRLQAANVA